ncbi:MAG: ATPase domain-containing protein [Balneolaceae bacterium]
MAQSRISTGLSDLDSIIKGGLVKQKAYLYRGDAGTGKSTAGYHFLEEGLKQGESTLLITLGESQENVLQNVSQMGIDLSKSVFLDLSPSDDMFAEAGNYSVFPSAEVESDPITDEIINAINRHKPTRVMLDSLTILQHLTQDTFQYRNMVLSFIRFVCSKGATLVMTSESDVDKRDDEAEFWVDGIINFIHTPYWRQLNVKKFRGSDFHSGNHSFIITGNGISVYQQLQPGALKRTFESTRHSFGINGMDTMLAGGIERGTITMVTGPTGVGKTNLGIQFMKEAASRNDRSVIYTFEESVDVIIKRSKLIGVPVDEMIETGNLQIKYIPPFGYSPDEFSNMVQTDIEKNNTKNVMIDTVKAYSLSVRDGNSLERLHSLCIYMGNMGVTTFLISETPNITGEFVTTNLNASYLADNIIFLRYMEINGELRKAIGVLKKRLSDFEKTIRELTISSNGITVSEPLTHLRGILSGLPQRIDE